MPGGFSGEAISGGDMSGGRQGGMSGGGNMPGGQMSGGQMPGEGSISGGDMAEGGMPGGFGGSGSPMGGSQEESVQITTYIPVGTEVITKLGTTTTFSRLAAGDYVALIMEEDGDEQVIMKVYIIG